MNHNVVTVDIKGQRAVVELGQFPILWAPNNKKEHGKLLGNVARGFKASEQSAEKYKHDLGEKELLKKAKKATPKSKMHTLLIVNADTAIGFSKPSQESTNVANYLKSKMRN